MGVPDFALALWQAFGNCLGQKFADGLVPQSLLCIVGQDIFVHISIVPLYEILETSHSNLTRWEIYVDTTFGQITLELAATMVGT